MKEFKRAAFNDQYEIVSNEETFRRYVCTRLDSVHDEVLGGFWFSFGLQIIQTVLLGVIWWRIW